MGMFDRYEVGEWNVACDRCGWKFKSRKLRKEWNGLMTCFGPNTNECYEERQPQDFVRGRPEKQTAQYVPFEPDPVFLVTPVTADDL